MDGKILIVEDDPLTKRFYDFVFKHCRFEIVQSEDAQEIFEILKNEKISLVILDVNLRNTVYQNKIISGIEISRMIKENEEFGNPKILIISAYNLLPNDDDYIYSKADQFILKPITDFNLFLETIRKLLNVE